MAAFQAPITGVSQLCYGVFGVQHPRMTARSDKLHMQLPLLCNLVKLLIYLFVITHYNTDISTQPGCFVMKDKGRKPSVTACQARRRSMQQQQQEQAPHPASYAPAADQGAAASAAATSVAALPRAPGSPAAAPHGGTAVAGAGCAAERSGAAGAAASAGGGGLPTLLLGARMLQGALFRAS